MVWISCKESMRWNCISIVIAFLFISDVAVANKEGYYGKFIGKLSQLHHGVSGDVYAVDARTLHLRNFNYDGEGPAAYFYAGNSKAPSGSGFRLRDERGTTNVLPRYVNKHITITLPEGKTLQNIRWFSVWCDEFAVNFGDVRISKNLDFPRPQKIGALNGVHGVSSDQVVIVDAQTLLIPSFSYDGEAPDAKFWVGRGPKPSPQGIRVPDENGKEVPLRRYDRKTIVLTLPGDLTVFDIGHFGVWCEAFTVDFGHVQIPRGLNIPPSLKMLGVSPQSKLNCEVLWDDLAFEVRWAVAGDSIVLQLVAKLEAGEYMAFGLSGDSSRSKMVGGDVTVAWVDKDTLKGHAYDYFLDAKSQCSGGRGSCPDENISEKTNSVRLLNAALVNGYSIVTFQRSLRAQDELDKPVFINGTQPIIWAIGPLNARKEVSYHSLANRGDILIDFGRPPKWNCPTPESNVDDSEPEKSSSNTNHKTQEIHAATVEKVTEIRQQANHNNNRQPSRPKPVPTPAPVPKSGNAWEIPPIQCHEPEDGVFYAQMGPTGGKRGYSAITGHVGWGISWYINGLLIPEINVVRGRTYTFIVEGGLDPETPARYHPFYITDDPVGGYAHKTPEERAAIQIFAGAVQNKRGEVRPTGVGRLCNWTPDPKQPPADEFSSFGAYQRTLRLECDQGEPGIIQWTVDKDTPDTVYYQCYTHRYLGWKINVLDDCETEASEPIPSVVKPPSSYVIDKISTPEEDSVAHSSISHSTRIKPDSKYKSSHKTNKPEKTQFKENDNEFTKVKYVPQFTFYNEETGEPISAETLSKIKSQDEIKDLQKQYALQDPIIQQQIMEQMNSQPTKIPQHQLPQYEPIQSHFQQQAQQTIAQPTIQQSLFPQPAASVHHHHHHQHHPQHHQQEFMNIPVQLPQFKTDDQFIKFFHPSHSQIQQVQQVAQIAQLPQIPIPQVPIIPQPQQIIPQSQQLIQPQGLSMYSVSEHHEDAAAQNHQNFRVVPLPTPTIQTRKPEPDLMQALQNFHIKADIPSQDTHPLQFDSTQLSAQLPDDFKIDEKFNEEFLKNYQLLKAQAEENLKKHKQKLQQYNRATNKLVNGQALGSSTRLQYNSVRKPAPHHALTLQQRPLPPGMFRPPFLPPPVNKQTKRPAQAASQKVPTFSHPNNIPHRATRPPKPHRTSSHKINQIKLQQYLALQKQLESLTTFKPEFDTSALLTSSPVIVDKATENPIPAINTGFNPDSVKVEGGFKPIISTGIAPKSDFIDRMDENTAEEEDDDDNDDKIGVIDLRREDKLGEKSALFKDTKDELINVTVEERKVNVTEDQNATETATKEIKEELDLFKNQKPQMFEPMFIPSPPDNRIQKYQEKYKKKPIIKYNEMNLKYRNNQMQHYNTQKNNNYYVKIRPRPNLIRRPLYPNNMVPPFKIPVRGGSPQFRYQQSEESIEDTTDFEIIKMNNDSINTDDDKAENILEVLEMEEDNLNENATEPELDFNTEIPANTTEDEIAMADEQRDYYLPPRQSGVATTYDGKIVKAAPAPSLPTKKSSIDISKLPQFGPYRGDAPPLSQTVPTGNLPQLKNARPASSDILPPRGFPNPPSIQSTKLSLIRNYDQYEPQSSEIKETILKDVEIQNESTIGEVEHEGRKLREKRSPDHIPGHVGPHDHDDHDDHDHHDHQHSSNNSINLLPSFFLLSLICVQRFL